MEERYDVGIYGLWYGRNYGSISTYFALNSVIKKMGYTTVMIDNPLGKSKYEIDTLPDSHPRKFAVKHYEITEKKPLSRMGELNSICRSFVLGSDQMWNYGLSRPYKQSYFLDFAQDNKIKISCGTSFGKEPYNGPESEVPLIKKNLSRFSAISVRDDFSKRILEKTFHLESEQIIDPVFMCPPEVYEHEISQNPPFPYQDYVFAYILDPNPKIGESLQKVTKEGKELVIVFNENSDINECFQKLQMPDERVHLIGHIPVNVWWECFKRSDYVLTDSFHGACFSVIFHRPFTVLRNDLRGGSRFQCLLDPIGLSGQIITDPADFWNRYKQFTEDGSTIDYDEVERKLAISTDNGRKWLQNALRPLKSVNVTTELDKNMCMGCGACVSTCPVDAIKLQPDQWGYYRSCVDYTKCISCSKCLGVCPALKLPENTNSSHPDCYEYVSNDAEVLKNSSSGGIFHALANDVLEKNGVVVGAAWRDDLTVAHTMIDQKEEMAQLQKSKYLQSWLGDGIHRQVKKMLDEKRYVLFSGCPCQIAGLKAYLGKSYDKLITVDLLCGNSPSAGFFKKYLESTFPEGVSEYQFRYKKLPEYPWSSKIIEAVKSDGSRIIHNGERDDDYQRVYHSHVMCAPHCEKCRYQAFPRQGDITIGDFWGISRLDSEVDAKPGVSLVLLNSKKGAAYFEKATEQRYQVRKQVPLAWMGGNGYSRNGGRNWISPKRDLFYDVIREMPFREAVDYTLKPNHGISRTIYKDTQTPMLYDYKMHHFRFEANIWEELFIENKLTLIVKENKWKENGHYARLPLAAPLKKRKYRLSVKFRIRSLSDTINFHMIDSGSKILQIVHRENIKDRNDGRKWIEFSEVFVPETDYFDEFMIGAAQVSGIGNYISFAYINIKEEQ